MNTQNARHVAEIVSFELKDGVTDDAYLALTEPSHSYISYAPGFITRRLSKGSDGRWTDYTVWDNLVHAEAAAAGFMEQSFAPAMIDAIKPDSLAMHHQHILWHPA